MKKADHVIPVYLFIISAFCLIAAAAFFLWEHSERVEITENQEIYEPETPVNTQISNDGTEVVNEPTEDTLPVDASENNEETEALEPEVVEPEIIRVDNPYKDYFLENEDMIAWIKIPDTEIDYPVMWTPPDENFYLYKGFDKQYSRVGLPLMDTDSSMYPSSTNLIIHGHNIKNAMFFYILQYMNEDYYKEHPLIYLYGKDCEHIYEVMSVFKSKVFYTTDVCFKYYKFFNADTEEEFFDFYKNVKDMALYDTGVEAEFGDRFLTLSTCSSHTENGRFVVVAKEVEPGDIYLPVDESETGDETLNN